MAKMEIDEVIPVEECEAFIKWLLTPYRWTKHKCAKIERRVEDENDYGYTIHFHSEGRLRPWKKRIWLETHLWGKYYQLTREQAIYVISNHPDTGTIALHWLLETYPDFKGDGDV